MAVPVTFVTATGTVKWGMVVIYPCRSGFFFKGLSMVGVGSLFCTERYEIVSSLPSTDFHHLHTISVQYT